MNNLLASDHAELDELLDKLFASFDAGSSVEQIYQRLDLFWARLAMHIRAEQLHLFPAILGASEMRNQTMRVPSPDVVKDKISGLQEDHNFFMRELLSAIKQARDLRADNQTDLPSRLLGVREIRNCLKRYK